MAKIERTRLVASNHVSDFSASYHYSIYLAYPLVIGYVFIELANNPAFGKSSALVSVLDYFIGIFVCEGFQLCDSFLLCSKQPLSLRHDSAPFFSILKEKGVVNPSRFIPVSSVPQQ